MYDILLQIHAIFRWLIVIFLLFSIVNSLKGWIKELPYTKVDNLSAVLLISFTHLQLILGLVLYTISPIIDAGLLDMSASMKNPALRFWTVEHIVAMVAVVILITLGRIFSKKAEGMVKHKRGFIFYTIAFVIILWVGIIKPYLLGRGWF